MLPGHPITGPYPRQADPRCSRRLVEQPADLVAFSSQHSDARSPRGLKDPVPDLVLRDRLRHGREAAVPVGFDPPGLKPVLVEILALFGGRAVTLSFLLTRIREVARGCQHLARVR